MAKRASKPKKRPAKKKASVIHQVKEPLSLLNTLKEEGMANAITFLSMAGAMASGARKNLRPQLKELVSSLGFAFREDMERLEARLDELEHLLSEREYARLHPGDEE
jgi:hypothetical protein